MSESTASPPYRPTSACAAVMAISIVAVVILLRPGSPASAQAPAPDVPAQRIAGAPLFRAGECPARLAIPVGFAGGDVRCGSVDVPQSRTRAGLPALTLPVAIFTSETAPPGATPLIYLAGGPGGSGLDEVSLAFLDSPLGRRVVGERPVIAFDQRGSGLSLPSLDCPMLPEVDTDAAAIMEGADPTPLELVRACRSELEQRGIDLSSINTTETSHDVRDIIHALGYQRAIVMGTSYGTTGALFTMRNHPELVEAAILDGVAPPQWLDGYEEDVLEMEARLALGRFLDDCESDPVCGIEFPDLRGLFAELESRGDERLPVLIDEAGGGEALAVSFGLLAEIFTVMITEPSLAGLIPQLIADTIEGNAERLIEELGFLLVLAALSELPDMDPSDLPDEIERAPRANYDAVLCSDFPLGTPYGGRAVCDAWGVPYQGAKVSAPVVSRIPTLLLSGNYDYQTPPFWAQDTARTLPNSYSYVFPAAGHVVTYSQHEACVAVVVLSFIADPGQRPDDRCVDGLEGPRFVPRAGPTT